RQVVETVLEAERDLVSAYNLGDIVLEGDVVTHRQHGRGFETSAVVPGTDEVPGTGAVDGRPVSCAEWVGQAQHGCIVHGKAGVISRAADAVVTRAGSHHLVGRGCGEGVHPGGGELMIRPPAGVAADRLVVKDRFESGVIAAERFEVRVVAEPS